MCICPKEDVYKRQQHNCDCFKKQMSKFIDFSDGKALFVNNADWLMNLNYIEMLRDVGPHFTVNRMLAAECYKNRMRCVYETVAALQTTL